MARHQMVFCQPGGGRPALGAKLCRSVLDLSGLGFLGALSAITIIGWAWVYTAQTRWIYRNVEGTRREIVFEATGLDYLWRAVVVFFGCAFIIPIPWVVRWMAGWLASQTVLVERGTYEDA